MIFIKGRLVGIRLGAAWLIAGRPDISGLLVAEKNIGAPAVPGRVFTPASDGNVAPAAVPGACGRQHHSVAAIGKKLGAGSGIVRRT